MKKRGFPFSIAAGIALIGALAVGVAGCGHLDLTPPGDADRVLTGWVMCESADPPPPGSVVVVRVLDLSAGDDRAEVLGEQTIKNPGSWPIAFRVEYRAEDAVLRRRVDAEARIAVGRRLYYASETAHPITLGNAGEPHTIPVERVGGPPPGRR